MKRLHVGIDIDDVLYPWMEAFRTWLWINHRLDARALPDPTDYSLREWQLGNRERVTDLMLMGALDGMLLTHPPMDDVTVLGRLASEGHFLHLVTSRHPDRREDTERWLERWGVAYDELTFTKDKTEVELDIHLDDAAHHVVALAATRTVPVLRKQAWNASLWGTGPEVESLAEFRHHVSYLAAIS